jgi:6,7-dimethyl-8-ribityllumazine synthase
MDSTRKPATFQFEQKPHILIVQSPYYTDICARLNEGAMTVLQRVGVTYETVDVPGALEIPAAIVYAVKSLDFDATRRRFDGYVALACVMKGETHHDQIVGSESARALQEIAMRYTLAIGNGILTVNTKEQAMDRASINGQNRGGAAAEACLRMIELKHQFRLSPKRRWVAR